jgi:hypothetical protein
VLVSQAVVQSLHFHHNPPCEGTLSHVDATGPGVMHWAVDAASLVFTQIPPPRQTGGAAPKYHLRPSHSRYPPPNSQLFVPATGNSYPSVTSFGLGCRLLSHPVRSCAAGRLCLSDSRASTTAGGMNEAERLSILARRVRATDMVLNQEGEWQVHGRPAPTYPPTLAFAQQPTGVLTLWYPTRAGVCQGNEARTSRSEVSQPGSNERRGAPRRTPAAGGTPHE